MNIIIGQLVMRNLLWKVIYQIWKIIEKEEVYGYLTTYYYNAEESNDTFSTIIETNELKTKINSLRKHECSIKSTIYRYLFIFISIYQLDKKNMYQSYQ